MLVNHLHRKRRRKSPWNRNEQSGNSVYNYNQMKKIETATIYAIVMKAVNRKRERASSKERERGGDMDVAFYGARVTAMLSSKWL